MATIEERALWLAKEFGATKANKESAIYRACIRMAYEQKEIDNNDKKEGEALLYTANKVAEIPKKEMIDKAYEWLKERNVLPDGKLEDLRKIMEE